MDNRSIKPAVWIGSFGAYNEGRLIGRWYNLEDFGSAAELEDEAGAFMRRRAGELDPELNCFDTENVPGIRGECSPAEAWNAVRLLFGLDGDERLAMVAWLDDGGAADDFAYAYLGTWTDEETFAREEIEAFGVFNNAAPVLVQYFDYAAFARDLFIRDYSSTPAPGGQVFVFQR